MKIRECIAGAGLALFVTGAAFYSPAVRAGRLNSASKSEAKAVQLTNSGDNTKPCLAVRPAGGLYVSWAQKSADKTSILFSRLQEGGQIDPPIRVSTAGMHLDLGAESGPNLALDSKGGIYVVWTAGSTPAAPTPERSANPVSPGAKPHSGGHPPRPGNLNIWLARSEDDGKTFSAPVKVNDDTDGAEHRFPAAAVDPQGGICVAWLDKRKKTSAGEDMARVFFARSTDGGRSFGPNMDATSGQPNPICHCCRVAVTSDPQLGLMIAFRNDISDLRDMFLLRSTDEGRSFTGPTPLERTGWKLPSCPMDGPSLGVDRSGVLHAVWMSGANIHRKPLFGDVEVSDSKVLYNRVLPGSSPAAEPLVLGAGHHPRIAVGAGGEAFIVWHNNSIQLARIGSDTHHAAQIIQVAGDKGNPSYPSIALGAGGVVYCAWQQTMPDGSVQIYLDRIPAAQFAAKG